MFVSVLAALAMFAGADAAQGSGAASEAKPAAEAKAPVKKCYTSTPSGSRRPRKTCVTVAPPADEKPADEAQQEPAQKDG